MAGYVTARPSVTPRELAGLGKIVQKQWPKALKHERVTRPGQKLAM